MVAHTHFGNHCILKVFLAITLKTLFYLIIYLVSESTVIMKKIIITIFADLNNFIIPKYKN
jgi:hypothetical protein